MRLTRNALLAAACALALVPVTPDAAAPAVPDPVLTGLTADTIIEEEEGDRYILACDSLGKPPEAKPHPMKVFALVADQGAEGLARVGTALKPHGRLVLRREYFADISDTCDWVYETFFGSFAEGKAEGTWRHTVLFCSDTVLVERAAFSAGVRIKGASLKGARWEYGKIVSGDSPKGEGKRE